MADSCPSLDGCSKFTKSPKQNAAQDDCVGGCCAVTVTAAESTALGGALLDGTTADRSATASARSLLKTSPTPDADSAVAAAAAAAAEGEAEAKAEAEAATADVLTLLLQHPSFHEQRLVSSLLCTSKQMRDIVPQLLLGVVPIRCCVDGADLLARWLTRNGTVVKSLDIHNIDGAECDSALESDTAAAIAAALGQAAAAAQCIDGGLKIQAVKADAFSTPLLQQLARCDLTGLTSVDTRVKVPKDVEQSAAAVAQLTRLQSLSLQDCLQAKEECLTVNEVLPALSGLKQLTGLTLMKLNDEPHLQQLLPTQLRELSLALQDNWVKTEAFVSAEGEETEPVLVRELNFRQLTQLSKLEWRLAWECVYDPRTEYIPSVLNTGDGLPASVQELIITNCTNIQPLLQLKKLQRLEMTSSTACAAELQQLSQLRSLTAVTLTYGCPSEALAAAPSWGAVPLTSLGVVSSQENAAQLMHYIGNQRGLTRLCFNMLQPHGLRGMGDMLRKLANLCNLGLVMYPVAFSQTSSFDIPSRLYAAVLQIAANIACSAADTEAEVMSAVCALRRLEVLEISGLPAGQLTAAGLLALTCISAELTSLRVHACHAMDSSVLDGLAATLTGLRSLDLQDSKAVGDKGLAAVAQHLQQLTALDVVGTGVTDAGVRQLSCLTQMQELRVGQAISAAAKRKALGGW